MRFAPLAKQTSSTPGTGAYELLPPAPGFQSFVDAIGDGGTAMFVARDAAKSEVLIGTVAQGSPDTLARDNVIQSTDADAAINWAAGVRDIYLIGMPGMRGFVSVTNTATLQVADLGAFIRLAHADPKTYSLPPLTDCYDGFAVQLENAGAGTWTLDADGSDQIDGAGTATLLAGESCWLICRGTSWSIGGKLSAPEPPVMPRGYLHGLGLSNGTDATNDIDVALGECMSADHALLLTLAATCPKQLDVAFAEYSAIGTPSGGRDTTKSLADGTWHVFLIGGANKDTQPFFSTDLAPALPSGFTAYRRIHSILREAGAIAGFSQRGDEILRRSPAESYDNTITASAALIPLHVPAGLKVEALMQARFSNSAGGFAYLSSPDATDEAPSSTAAPGSTVEAPSTAPWNGQLRLRTDTSRQIRAKASGTGTETLRVWVLGWIDRRGRDE